MKYTKYGKNIFKFSILKLLCQNVKITENYAKNIKTLQNEPHTPYLDFGVSRCVRFKK